MTDESEDRSILNEGIPTGPGGKMAPGSMPHGIHRSLGVHGPGAEDPRPGPTPEEQAAQFEEDQEELEAKTDRWKDKEWEKQRYANLRSGIITPRDSRTYRKEIKRDIDGDILMDEENLEREKALKAIAPRPAGWMPYQLQRVRTNLPQFLRRLLVGK